ncbi:MAG: alginate export family protein [Pseudomonadota bacterium]
MRRAAILSIAAWLSAPALADPWRLDDIDKPNWLTLSGEARIRYESLGEQFRAGGSGGDQLLAMRTLLLAEAEAGTWTLGIEMQDSRTYLDDNGTPLSSSFVNTLEPLQLYAKRDAFGGTLKLGRQTLDIASRRFVERNDFRNTINGYSGGYWRGPAMDGTLHVFAVAPVGKEPASRSGRDANAVELDETEWGRVFWGLHYVRPKALGSLQTEVFAYGLNEDDRESVATADRSYVELGGRLLQAPQASRWDFEIEGAYRFGERSTSSGQGADRALDVSAETLHAALGYSWAGPWQLRLALEYDYASGDDTPSDSDFGTYERLFGTRRGDLGNTSIHGPLTRQNINAPGARASFKRGRYDGRLHWRAAYLASDTDSFRQAGLRDPSGQSGDFAGHSIDGRVRYWIAEQSLRLELGGSIFLKGRFAREAPGAPNEGDTLYGYAQLTATF